MILNKDYWPRLTSWGDVVDSQPTTIEYRREHTIYFNFKELNDNDELYWYVEFLHGDAFYHYPLEQVIPDQILRKIQRGDIKLLLCNAHESYHYIIEDLYKYVVIGSNIQPKHIMLLSESADIHKEIELVSTEMGLDKIPACWMLEFELGAQTELRGAPHFYASNTLEDKTYYKKFISFNGFQRAHRTTLVMLLHSLDLLDYGYVSYNSVPLVFNNPAENYDHLLLINVASTELLHIFQNNKFKICGLQSIRLDSTVDTHKDKAQYKSTSKVYYENSYFSLVTETACYRKFSAAGKTGFPGRLLSEKIFKAIINRHPFVLAGVPKSLIALRSLGYRTFSPYINEDYDLEMDDATRMLMIGREVNRLVKLSPTELSEFIAFSREVVEHNVNVLLNQTQFIYPLN